MTLGIFHPKRIIAYAIIMTTAINLIAGFTTRRLFDCFIGGILGGVIYDLIIFGVKWLVRLVRRSRTT